jgi:hypothetical protein
MPRVAFADVTSDRHPDVLVEQYPHTNDGCGPHQVVATLAKGNSPADLPRLALRDDAPWESEDCSRSICRTNVDGDSVCCWSKVEKLRLRWNGHRYVTVSDRIVRS